MTTAVKNGIQENLWVNLSGANATPLLVSGTVTAQLASGSNANPIYVVVTTPASGTSTNPAQRLSVLQGAINTISGAVTGSREVYLFEGMNNSASTLYFQIYNTGSLPVGGAVPLYSIAVPALSPFSRDLSNVGGELFASNGVSVAWSTSSQALGPPTAALCRDVWFNVWYR